MRRRGLVLILAIFFLGLLQLLVLAFAHRLPLELYGSVRYELDNEAFLAADAGLQHTLAWLEQKLEQGADPTPATRTGQLNGFSWKVEITPEAGSGPRAWWLVSQARRGHTVYRTLSLGVKQESFAYYARLVDDWPAGVVSLAGEEGYDGPVHTNSALRVGLATNYESTGPVLFKSGATYSVSESGNPDHVDYDSFFTGPRPYTGSKATQRQRYRRLYGQQGRQGLRHHKAIPLPSPDENLRQASWGPSAPPTTAGVYLQSAGGALTHGVYIRGDVDSLELAVDSGQPVQRIRLNNGDLYVITERSDDTTLVQGPGGPTTYQKHPNGLLFCTGDVRGLFGRNQGPHTVAVATGGNHKVTLADSVTPVGLSSPPAKPANGDHPFGIIAHSLVLPDDRGARKFVYGALLLAGADGQGGAIAESPGSGAFNDFFFVGSVTTQRTHPTMMPAGPTGWSTHYVWDPELRKNPPPAFPGLSGLQVVAYSSE